MKREPTFLRGVAIVVAFLLLGFVAGVWWATQAPLAAWCPPH